MIEIAKEKRKGQLEKRKKMGKNSNVLEGNPNRTASRKLAQSTRINPGT